MSDDETILDALRAQASAWRLRSDRLSASSDVQIWPRLVHEAEGQAKGNSECAADLEALIERWTK